MAIQSNQSNQSVFNLRYSAFLGMMYLSNDESEALISEAKSLVGVEEAKKGFKGSKGDSASAKALDFLRQKGVTPVSVSGILNSARIIERDVEGRPTPYLHIGLREGDERYYVSVNLAQEAAQMLVRKLINAEFGVHTDLRMFATYGQREGANRAYADHGASLRQGGSEIKSVSPKEHLAPRIDADKEKLQAAGITDKETLAARRAKIELEFHVELMSAVAAKVEAYFSQTELPQTDNSAAA
ncbi:hypothetical protein D0C16_08575 [Cellvibrio sp. KY-GH-1]|uniref:hypothetical protein n=1 Tax=Cellvibrio sp. KY-GH-1 TaxID=2303332 RepID=UPI00124883EB|nr:hypothetical protein [Cellvibrio sp. KY-GH-1]QEY16028.1 hypothetical protein D0C16_08575 [Cellvibrio sp. KY-GH-1]